MDGEGDIKSGLIKVWCGEVNGDDSGDAVRFGGGMSVLGHKKGLRSRSRSGKQIYVLVTWIMTMSNNQADDQQSAFLCT